MSLLIWERQITVLSGPPQEYEEWQFGSLVRIRQGDCNVLSVLSGRSRIDSHLTALGRKHPI